MRSKELKTKELKRYIVRKYVLAKSAEEAIKKEYKYRPDDCWLDEDWKKSQEKQLESAIGFNQEPRYED